MSESTSDLAELMVKAAHNYSVNYIRLEKDRLSYTQSTHLCLYYLNTNLFGHSLHGMLSRLKHLYSKSAISLPKSSILPLVANERKYYLLAIEQAIEAVESLIRRFDTGTRYPDSRLSAQEKKSWYI